MPDILISMNKTTDRLWKYADEWEKTPEHFDGVNPFCVAIHAVRQTTNAPELPKGDQGWIRVEDRLPKMHMTYEYVGDPPEKVISGIHKSRIVQVAVLCKESGEPEYFVGRGFLRNGEWWESDGFVDSQIPFEVTHWMPLPEPPEEVKPDADEV